MHENNKGSWSVATTIRAPEYQVNQFLEHYVGLGADRIYVFFDDPAFSAYDRARFRGKVFAFVCDEEYWSTMVRVPPLDDRVGRPDAVETRQSMNALYAREMMASEWLLHVDVDEFIYARKPVAAVLSAMPRNVFSVLLKNLEAVYDEVKAAGQETDTVYFKKALHNKAVLREFYSDDLLKCASAGLWGTLIGKTFVRKGPAICSMSVHWPIPADNTWVSAVPTDYIDLLHFEGQSYDLFKEKSFLRLFKNVARYMPGTYHARLDITKRAYEAHGERGLLDVYRQFYVMDPEKLERAIALGFVVKLPWKVGQVADGSVRINNPTFELDARISNWSGTLVESHHNTFLGYDLTNGEIRAFTGLDLLRLNFVRPVEIETYPGSCFLFVRVGEDIHHLSAEGGKLTAKFGGPRPPALRLTSRDGFFNVSADGRYLSIAPDKSVTIDRVKASWWERLRTRLVLPQLSR